MLRLFLFAVLAAILASGATPAAAHDSRPLSITIREAGDGAYVLSWRAPASVEQPNAPSISLGEPCRETLAPRSDDLLAGAADYACSGGLEGAVLHIDYPFFNPSLASLVRVERLSGEVSTAILAPDVVEWSTPAPERFDGVARSYFRLGVEHILIGIDHILFLGGLLFLARTPKRVLTTVTGFTVAHSITLALVALDMVRVSVPVIEALIALSIVFVAAEIARGRRDTIAWKRPVVVASTFGLLHGAGFAAVLGEIGLPQTERVAALLFFNLGVEAGQVLLVVAAFGGLWLLRRARTLAHQGYPAPFPAEAPLLFAYGLGAISTYWFVERSLSALA